MPEPRRIWNPPNPYLSAQRELLGEAPVAPLEIYEDQSKSILSENDSPDIGFRWSINPYRGCFHACSYCVLGDTPILMGDGRTKPMADVQSGDVVYGTVLRNRYRRYVRTQVLAHWSTIKPAYRVCLEDGTELIASADHRFLTQRGWKYVTNAAAGHVQRAHLTLQNELLGTGRFATPLPADVEYRRGYLAGIIRGDGTLGTYCYDGRRRAKDSQHRFRLALADIEALERTRGYLQAFGVGTEEFAFGHPATGYRPMRAIRTSAQAKVERVRELIQWPLHSPPAWSRGFLAGIFDAEGSYSGSLRISNTDAEIVSQTQAAFGRCGFHWILDAYQKRTVQYVRLRGGLSEVLRFFHSLDPAISRKRNIEGQALKSDARLRVVEIKPLGLELPMFDITTGTGDFIANGVVSHNCYARRTHEYFGFGAGTDFERKIFVKLDAPRLLEQAFRKPSWRGERLMFSGVTDCYQPLEAAYKLTQSCLKVCLAFRNPIGIITKSLLIRRDAQLLADLAREADASVSISIPFLDEAIARAIEPGAPTIRRRFETLEILARAGVPVGIGVAPVIPGLNDRDIPGLLKRAKESGAQFAFHTLLRLPGSVREVFLHRLKEALPLKTARVIHRIQDSRGGKFYDSRFGHRYEGQGVYWDMVEQLWRAWVIKLGFDRPQDAPQLQRPPTFRVPPLADGQLRFRWGPLDDAPAGQADL